MQATLRAFATAGLLLCATIAAAQSSVTKQTVPGITNFSKVETTVACAGATTPAALADVKKMGYNSVINLRLASEAGAQIDEEAAAAKAAGINYIHLPFNAQSPDPMLVDNFLKAITDKANQPAFIHCASGNRASALWAIKRVKVDHWDVDRALAEATDLGDRAELRRLAAEVGLESDRVEHVVADPSAYLDRVEGSTREANAAGINAIPAFLLYRRLIVLGAQPLGVFRRAFEQLAA